MNCVTENGSALHEASFYGRIDIVSILLDYGIDTSLQNQQGKNVFDLLDQLNTSVSRTIESIIENHTALNSNHRIERRQSPLNKSTSLHILPPEQYKDKNQTPLHMNSELVAYAAAAEANQYSPNYSLDYVQPPKEFAQHSSSMNYYLDGGNAKFNSSHRPSRRKVSPMTSHCNEAKLKGNFSRSQDSMNSILDDYLQTVNAQHQSLYDQPKQLHKKKSKPQLSAFAQPIYTSSTKYPVNHPSDDLYSSLDVDEPIYSYPATGCNDQQQPHSLQNDYLEQHYNEQIQPYSSFNYNDHNHHTSAHNLTNNQNLSSSSSISKQYNRQHQFNHQKIQSNHSSKSMNNRNSQSHHQLNYLNSQKIYASNINYQVERAPSHDSGYSMATYQTLDRDRDLSNQDRSFCSMNCDQLNSSYSLSNQEQLQQSQVLMRNGGELGMKRSMSNTSDSYLDNLSASCSSSKDLTSLPNSTANYSTLKRYSSVVDELKTNRLSRNVHPAMETVQRIKVNSNDLYAQIDKTRKNSLKATNTHTTSSISQNTSSSKIQDLLDFYDQPSKLIKKVTAGTNDQITTNKTSQTNGSKMINHMTAEQLELYTEIGKKVEKSQTSSSNKNKSTNHSFDQPANNNNNNNSISSDQLRSQATFVKAKLNREKRATIAITLNENEIGELSFEARPPSPKMAANQISKILRPIHENYKKMKLKPNKHTMTDEKQFNRFQSGKKMVIIEKDLDRSNIVSVDKSTCTEEDREEERETKTDTLKDKTQVKNADAENRKPTTNDLIDLDELKKLEDKFNEIKSTTKDNNNQITSSKVNSIQRPRRQAPAPPLPAHQGKETDTLKSTGSSATVNTETTNLNEKILEKVDKNLSSKERDLLTKSLNLPLNLDWKHDPLILYKQTCHYLAFYLGSNKLKNLQSALSSQQCIRSK